MKEVTWTGTVEKCDICGRSLSRLMFDANVRQGNRTFWANVCLECFVMHGDGLGLGKGQQFEKQADGKWLKTAG